MTFCMYCGKQLEEGTQCGCLGLSGQVENPMTGNQIVNGEWNMNQTNTHYQQGMNIQYQQEMNPHYQQSMNPHYQQKRRGGFGAWISIVKSPVAAGNSFVQASRYQAGIGLIVLQAILTGIFGISICYTINKEIKEINMGIMELGNFFSGSAMSINLILAFVLTFSGSILLSLVRTGLLLGGIKISTGRADWKRVVCICGVRAVGVNLVQVLSLVVGWMNLFLGIVLFAFSWIVGLIFMIPSILECVEDFRNKSIYILILVTIICLITLVILYDIGIPMYIPKGLKDLEDGFDGISSFFQQFL